MFDSILKFLLRAFTSRAAKEVGKAALDAGKTLVVDTVKKLIERALKPKAKISLKTENIVSK